MNRLIRVASTAAALCAVAAPATGDPVSPGSMVRASRTAVGGDANGRSAGSAISADGTVVAFTSEASNLVSGDSNNVEDTFVRDIRAGTVERVSLSASGLQSQLRAGWDPDVSADGRHIAFTRSGPSPPDVGVFLHDRTTRTTERISITADGEPFYAFSPSVSGDGTAVVMANFDGAWLWTRAQGFARRLLDPATGKRFDIDELHLSADGSTVVMALRFPWGVAIYDIARHSVEHIFEDLTFKFSTTASADGRSVGFLRVREGSFFADIVIFDRQTGGSSILLDATEAMGPARMASDGRHVVFGSIGVSAAAPVPGTWIWDRVTDRTRFVSFDNNGVPSASNQPEAVSHDASAFTYSTEGAMELDDRNEVQDVYVRDQRGPCAVACLLPSGGVP